MNITSVLNATTVAENVVTEYGLNWFAESELAWGCFHYVTLAYIFPVNCVIGFCENLAILYVLYHMTTGVGESARFYYALLAIFNICNIILLDIANGWLTIGLRFATQGRFYLSATIYNEWFCKIFICLYMPTYVLLMWTYVLFNTERVVAIASPLKAKSLFTVRRNLLYVVIVGAFGIVLMIDRMTVQRIASTLDVIGTIQCLPGSENLFNMIIYQVATNLGIFTLPPALSLILGVLLFFVIRRQMAARFNLLSGPSRSIAIPTSSAITGGVVVIIMAIVHSALNLPAGIFGCLYFMYAFDALHMYEIFVLCFMSY